MSFEVKRRKKSCILCNKLPQNILILACDHSICLQCAYFELADKFKRQDWNDVQFQCRECKQPTYFQKDLIMEIRTSVQKNNSFKQHPHVTENSCINSHDNSFIDKMKKQYFSQSQNISPLKYKNQPDFTAVQSHKNKYFSNFNTSYKTSNKNSQKKYQKEINMSKEKYFTNKSVKNTISKCPQHPQYEVIYFCSTCEQIVCPECLLRGSHKQHQNQSISEILQNQFPQFITETSSLLLQQIDEIQHKVQTQSAHLNQKVTQIEKVKYDAIKYFEQVEKNIQKQKNQVLNRCHIVLENFKSQKQKVHQTQKQYENQIILFISQIKHLKKSYQNYLSTNFDCINKDKKSQKLLICDYKTCQKQINQLLTNKKHRNTKQNERVDSSNDKQIANNHQMRVINQQFLKSVDSLRQSIALNTLSKPNYQSQIGIERSYMPSQICQKIKNKGGKLNQINHISTQKSENKSFSKKLKARELSPSLSPYKGSMAYAKSKNIVNLKRISNSKQDQLQQKLSNYVRKNDLQQKYRDQLRIVKNETYTTKILTQNDLNQANFKEQIKNSNKKSTKNTQNFKDANSKSKKKSIPKKNTTAKNSFYINKFRM